MRTIRTLLTLTSVTCIAVGGLVACGDDDSPSGPTTSPDASTDAPVNVLPDASKPDGSSTVDSGTAPIAAVAAPAVYVGQTAVVDGSVSTGSGALTFAWTLTAPNGSALMSTSLQNANTAKPTFVPDVPGAYTVALTVTAGGKTASATATLNAIDAPVFFLKGEADGGGITTGKVAFTGATNRDVGSSTSVACFASDAGVYNKDELQFTGAFYAEVWEAPAGTPSRAVFSLIDNADGGTTRVLFGTTTAATCAAAPTRLDTVGPDQNDGAPFQAPRFSPDGARVAYIRAFKDVGQKIATAGFDGTSTRVVADRGAFADGGPNPNSGGYSTGSAGPRPDWLNATTVAWVNATAPKEWQVVSAPDQVGATPTLHMKCTGEAPKDFAILPNGDVLVSHTTHAADNDAKADVMNIWLYKPDATTKVCGTGKNLSKLTSSMGASAASTFSLSPGRTKVAFYAQDDNRAGAAAVHVVPVDGSTDPVAVGVASSRTQGPRWVAGGTHLTWGVVSSAVDGGLDGGGIENALVVATVGSDAGPRVVQATNDPNVNVIAISAGSCSFGAGVGSGLSGFGFLGLLGLRIVRRRKKA